MQARYASAVPLAETAPDMTASDTIKTLYVSTLENIFITTRPDATHLSATHSLTTA